MKKILLVIDMQNDFVDGALGSPQAQAIVPFVMAKVDEYKIFGNTIIFTRDTHYENYLNTQEGKRLPVAHCIEGTEGHNIIDELDTRSCEIFDKPTFGSLALAKHLADITAGTGIDEIELCGLCSDICVVSNALILKAQCPETTVTVDARYCAGISEESHKAALLTMKMCQVNVIGENDLEE